MALKIGKRAEGDEEITLHSTIVVPAAGHAVAECAAVLARVQLVLSTVDGWCDKAADDPADYAQYRKLEALKTSLNEVISTLSRDIVLANVKPTTEDEK